MKKAHARNGGILFLLILVVASIYLSPYWTIYRMRAAIMDHDAAAFSERVDFPALRDSLKGQLSMQLDQRMGNPDTQNNPFAMFGNALATTFINRVVDVMVTPEGVMAMMKDAKTTPPVKPDAQPVPPSAPAPAPEPAQTQAQGEKKQANEKTPAEYALHYLNWSTVRAEARNPDGKSGAFLLKRSGLWGWKLSAVELPAAA